MTPKQIAALTETEKIQAALTVLHGVGEWFRQTRCTWVVYGKEDEGIIKANLDPIHTPEGREQVRRKLQGLGVRIVFGIYKHRGTTDGYHPQSDDGDYAGDLVLGTGLTPKQEGRALLCALLEVAG